MVDIALLVKVIGDSKPKVTNVLIGANFMVLTHSQVDNQKLILFFGGQVGGLVFDSSKQVG